jgi:hypothetical protein
MKHHFLHHNQLVVEDFNSERKKGNSRRYHFTLEASRLKEDFEGLRLGSTRVGLLLANSLALVLRRLLHH